MDAVAEEEDDAWFLQTLEQELENELEEGEEETVTRIVDEVPQASSRQGGQGGAETEIETKSKSIASILEESSAALAAEVAKVADGVEVEKEDRDSVARERVVVSLVDDEPSPSGRITTTEPQKRGPFKRPGRKRARTDKQGFRPPSSTIPSLPTEVSSFVSLFLLSFFFFYFFFFFFFSLSLSLPNDQTSFCFPKRDQLQFPLLFVTFLFGIHFGRL